MTLIHKRHDALFKDSLKERQLAVDFLRAHLPPDIYNRLDISTLQLTDKSLLTPELKEIHSDIVYLCQMDGKEGYIPILFLLEHFSTAPEHIAFRLLQYVVNLMNDALKAGSKKLPLVLPLCIYHGETSPFPQSTDIYEDFDDPALARTLVFKPFSLIDLTTIPDETIRQHGVASLMEMLLKHARERDFGRAVGQLKEGDTLSITLTQTTEPYLRTVIKYALSSAWSENQAEKVLEIFLQALPDKREVIMSAAQQLIERGMQASHADVWQAAQQAAMQASHADVLAFGERRAKLETAKNLLAAKVDTALVMVATGLEKDDLAAISDTDE